MKDLLALAGITTLIVGAWLIYQPLAVCVGGAAMIALAIIWDLHDANKNPD
jgi:hypothetical protein